MEFEAVGVTELNFGQWCASAGIVNDVFHYTSKVTVLFCEVECSELRWSLIQASVGRWSCILGASPFCGLSSGERTENGSTTLPLVADHSTHGGLLNIVVSYGIVVLYASTDQRKSLRLELQVADVRI